MNTNDSSSKFWKRFTARWWGESLYFILLTIILIIIFLFLFEFLIPFIPRFEFKDFILSGLVLFLSLIISSLIIAFTKSPQSLNKKDSLIIIGFNFDKSIIFYFSYGFLFAIFTILIVLLTGLISSVSISFVEEFDIASLLFFSIFVFIYAASEELVFRGVVFQALVRKFNPFLITIILSLIFALAHGLNPGVSLISIVNIFLAGVFLSYCYLTTKSMYLPIFAHFFWNWSQPVFLGTRVSGFDFGNYVSTLDLSNSPDWILMLTGNTFGVEEGILSALILSTFTLYYIKIMKPSDYISSINNIVMENDEKLLTMNIFSSRKEIADGENE
jgi:CAAX protease family protein